MSNHYPTSHSSHNCLNGSHGISRRCINQENKTVILRTGMLYDKHEMELLESCVCRAGILVIWCSIHFLPIAGKSLEGEIPGCNSIPEAQQQSDWGCRGWDRFRMRCNIEYSDPSSPFRSGGTALPDNSAHAQGNHKISKAFNKIFIQPSNNLSNKAGPHTSRLPCRVNAECEWMSLSQRYTVNNLREFRCALYIQQYAFHYRRNSVGVWRVGYVAGVYNRWNSTSYTPDDTNTFHFWKLIT